MPGSRGKTIAPRSGERRPSFKATACIFACASGHRGRFQRLLELFLYFDTKQQTPCFLTDGEGGVLICVVWGIPQPGGAVGGSHGFVASAASRAAFRCFRSARATMFLRLIYKVSSRDALRMGRWCTGVVAHRLPCALEGIGGRLHSILPP